MGEDYELLVFAFASQGADALGARFIECDGKTKDSCKFGDSDPIVSIEGCVAFVFGLRRGSALVANDECDEELIAFGEPEEFAVIDDVHRVFVVRTSADEGADLVEDGGEVEDQFHALVELVLGHQVREEFSAQSRDVACMCLVEGVTATEVDRRSDDLISQFDGPSVAVGEFGKESITKIRICDEELIAFEFFGEQSVAHQCGPKRIGIGEAHRVSSNQLFFLELSDVTSEG